MARSLILLLAAVASAAALNCYTCDSFLSCNSPRVEYCPPSTVCYTVYNNGRAAYMGCSASCSALPYSSGPQIHCTQCNHDHCNRDASQGTQNGRFDQQQPSFNNANEPEESLLLRQQQRRSIGYGAGVQQPSIGSGVSGGGSYGAYDSHGNYGVGSGAAVGNQYGGIGSGVGVGHEQHKHKDHHQIGHGAHAGNSVGQGAQPHGGIGGGAAPKHGHRQRRDGNPGIGQGVRPTRSAPGTLLAIPISLIVARIFN